MLDIDHGMRRNLLRLIDIAEGILSADRNTENPTTLI